MGSIFSVDECTSTDNPRVRDCCHLEGETPIEIRIAYQQPRQSAHPSTFDPGPHGAQSQQALGSRGSFESPSDQRQWSPCSLDAEKPPMPRGTERLRLPPPSGRGAGLRGQPRTPASQASTSDFDAEVFAAPPDSERSELGATPGRMQQPAALQMVQCSPLPDDDYFPEIVRASHAGSRSARSGTNTFREDPGQVPTYREGAENVEPPVTPNNRSTAGEAPRTD
mmetsp:Transcript_124355/g.277321  ORF Transcript_124355/g.277321 Transcript_124355/m.277321 type:complete len:224 (-) Transcript_124355:50-721(-)